eukprot:COSAG04_NODE_79_length_28132_cov_136.219634_4_plen_164_part_00
MCIARRKPQCGFPRRVRPCPAGACRGGGGGGPRPLGKPDLEAAFKQCRNKWEPVVIYTSPPPGRSHFMINWGRPFDPQAAASGEMPGGAGRRRQGGGQGCVGRGKFAAVLWQHPANFTSKPSFSFNLCRSSCLAPHDNGCGDSESMTRLEKATRKPRAPRCTD